MYTSSRLDYQNEFIEHLQKQNKTLVGENKSKATIIQILVENQNSLNRVQFKYLKLLYGNQIKN